jgi:hypothetical protein
MSAYPTLSGTNTCAGKNAFNINLPTPTLTATAGTQFITKVLADATYTTSTNVLGSNNIWTESNTFNNNAIANSTTITPTVLSYISSLSSNAQTTTKCKGSVSIYNIYRHCIRYYKINGWIRYCRIGMLTTYLYSNTNSIRLKASVSISNI